MLIYVYIQVYSAYIIYWLEVEVGFIDLRGGVKHEILSQLIVSSRKQLVEDVEIAFSLWTLSYSELLEEECLKRRWDREEMRRACVD